MEEKNPNSLPVLTAITQSSKHSALTALRNTGDLLVFQRRGRGLIGTGELVRAEFSGPERFKEAEAWWMALCDRATVRDAVRRPSSGLAAFGAFTFSSESEHKSVLIVPEKIIGIDELGAFETQIMSTSPAIEAGGTSRKKLSRTTGSSSWIPSAVTENHFLSLVALAKTQIQSGNLHKVVVARDLVRGIYSDSAVKEIVEKLLGAYPNTFVFLVDGLVGASPETLASVRGKTISLRVLAGSAPRGVSEQDDQKKANDLATSTKHLDEHRFAVQNVLHTLERDGITAAADDVPFQLKLPNLWHLATDIRAVLPQASNSIQVIGALHPTAAVAGSPTDAALDFIHTHESLDRGRYAGPVGWVDANGDGDWAIALRCGQIDRKNKQITAYAGAGIIAESDATAEFLETELKFRPIVDAVNEQLF